MDLLNLFKKDLLIGLNCHHLGTIQSFNAVDQTAKVTINYKKTFFKPNTVIGGITPTTKDYPVIVDAPVISIGGGNGMITFPIKKGDECLVLFNDRNIDNWFSGSTTSPVATGRLHSFSDAIILVGVRSLPNVILNYNGNEPEFRSKDGQFKITLKNDSVEIVAGAAKISVKNNLVEATSGTTKLSIDNIGKFKVQNTTGEFVAALIQFLQTATAGGSPIVGDLSVLQSFKG